MKTISNKTYSAERSLYNIKKTNVENCVFKDPENIGESPLKECKKLNVKGCLFYLRYPLWHLERSIISNSEFFDTSRAAFWYDSNLVISDSKLNGIKALRECNNIKIKNSSAKSQEFCWKCNDVLIDSLSLESEYPFFSSKNIKISNLKMKGKYSFQYCENIHIKDSKLDTKDAFWHAKNVVIENCEINGEYIGWYSDKLTLINCKISGTQPFCYCNNLVLKNCELIKGDLAFEYSKVKADLVGNVVSIKNPLKGYIKVDSVDEIIKTNSKYKSKCKIIIRSK